MGIKAVVCRLILEAGIKTESMRIIYSSGDLLLGQSGETYYLRTGEGSYQLSSNSYEPCLYIEGPDGFCITIHHAFTLDELCSTAQTNGSMELIEK